jgi:hypothetical protein
MAATTIVAMALAVSWTRPAIAQTGVRAYCANGQVWVVWEPDPSPPETYAIYASETAFTTTSEAELIGRLFELEWTPGELRENLSDPLAAWVIPDSLCPADTLCPGLDTLTADAGLFVETVHETEAKYYGVVAWGDTLFTAGVNRTLDPVASTYDLAVPPRPVLQRAWTLPGGGFTAHAYAMWADGRDDHTSGRPDFPVMANRHKNGMPSLFFVSQRVDPGPGPYPVTHWLHGGSMRATEFLPLSKPWIRTQPGTGLLVLQNDGFIRWRPGPILHGTDSQSHWFGWCPRHDPFDASWTGPAPGDTIVNYTQRRIWWIHDWVIANWDGDRERVSINGFSVGSLGTLALAKAFPDSFATASLFCCGFHPTGPDILGDPTDNFPTTLSGPNGAPVGIDDLFDLTTPVSASRDVPLIRIWDGKLDASDQRWDAAVVEQMRRADSLGAGMQIYWDGRPHAVDGLTVRWSFGTGQNQQTERDNVAYEERYRVHHSFPAFHFHHIYPGNADPGDGNPAVGDPWGTWGGWHDWNLETIADTSDMWAVTAVLIDNSAWPVDDCPFDSLIADMAIRKPQQFHPLPNAVLAWDVRRVANNALLQSGQVVVGADGLVTIPRIHVRLDPDSVRIRVIDTGGVVSVALEEGAAPAPSGIEAWPNVLRAGATTSVRYRLPGAAAGSVRLFDVTGRLVRVLGREPLAPGAHALVWNGTDNSGRAVAPGTYFARLESTAGSSVARILLVR